MTRPTIAQLCTGTLIVVVTTVALLAVSGESGVFQVAVLVAFAVTLGTVATALAMSASAARRGTHAGTHAGRPSPRPLGPTRTDATPGYAHSAGRG